MTRGIELSKSKKASDKWFLSEIFENVQEEKIKFFLERIINEQIDAI